MKGINMLYEILKAETHEDVIKLFEKDVDLSEYVVTHHKLWSLYVPKDVKEFLPVLSAHTDTVHKVKPKDFLITDNVIRNKDPMYGCGFDDRAGVYIMHELIKCNQPYIYLICDQEETGGIGGEAFAKSPEFQGILEYASCFIGLDRKGSTDCASYGYDNDEMFELMAEHGGYEYAYGTFTDVVNLSDKSELACCNLSIGYENEHRATETLNVMYMQETLEFLMHYIPEDFWNKQFKATVIPKRNYWYPYDDYLLEEDEEKAVLCDMCGSHEALYNVSWGLVCKTCLGTL